MEQKENPQPQRKYIKKETLNQQKNGAKRKP